MILEKTHKERNGIWWLASYPKSGNTWVRMFVNSALSGFPPDINSAFQYASGDHLDAVYQLTCAIKYPDQDMLELIWYRPAVLLNHLALLYPRDSCLKTHNANITLCDIPLCPHSISKGALYIIRDPRDVAISFSKHMGLTLNKAIEAMSNKGMKIHHDNSVSFHYISSWSNHVNSWTRDDNPISTKVVRYEDLQSDPRKYFRVVLEALGISYRVTDERLDWAISQNEFKKLKKQEEKNGFREKGSKQPKFFNKGKVGGWKTILSKTQVKRIETENETILSKFYKE